MAEFDPYQSPSDAFGSEPLAQSVEGRHTRAMIAHLRATRPWVVFLAVLGFVGCGLLALGGLSMVAVAVFFPLELPTETMIIGLIYLPLAGVYFIPALFLIKYGTAIGELMQSNRTMDLEQALDAQRGFWRAVGIIGIVMLALTILALPVGLIIAAVIGFS